ncbi:acetyl-CoA carboxylase biotin carboxylase subunit [Candidatus Anaplasma sp. TIGMIC]|uniref:acetyl-CoA carboxylase biotin carboxylase subunit n=1 Tax=Candidatus Anaplasma sp. TIGMIC TaxID=3020713 RepID=UPI00232BFE46|nr:acetyl-CoA carboxylase biotin carboxylase subunit [Candidatus Anaplasma sp. TIGMIC]MDB1135003.1 acetyl-CoA carboxylase biotin carboxylase subunit [Candidatus Anaplasma sp. TIGMIC]
MIKKILIANRGEIACRIARTAHKMGIRCVGVYSDADRDALHTQCVDEAVYIGPSPASQSYLDIDKICGVAVSTGADAVHPGYGFLSENAEFPDKLSECGIEFIGPAPSSMRMMADKVVSKKIAKDAGVAVVPGYMGVVATVDQAKDIAKSIGFPVMIKAAAGGGGKGMRIVHTEEEMEQAFVSSTNEAKKSFSDCRIFIEKYIVSPRHIEIQIIADKQGNVVCLGERECSIQRNNQKVIEETPSPFLDNKTRRAMFAQCVNLAKKVNYFSAGTVEFIVNADREFYFLEMNTRLQVEHPVTELVTGIDLVEKMIQIAEGAPLPFTQKEVRFVGSAIEARVYAEDPGKGFLPSSGRISHYHEPPANVNLRIDSGVTEGSTVSMFYDPMIAKVSSYGETRAEAIETMKRSLSSFYVGGVVNNIDFLLSVFCHPSFVSGDTSTGFIPQFYKSGFKGDELTPEIGKIFALALLYMYLEEEKREYGEYVLNEKVCARVGEWKYAMSARSTDGGIYATLDDSGAYVVLSGTWLGNYKMLNISIDDSSYCIKVSRSSSRYHLKYMAVGAICTVHGESIDRLLEFMPEAQEDEVSRDTVVSPIAGMIVEIYVKKGDKVSVGQPLLVIEAMKMENLICSEVEAEVEEVLLSPGSSVANGEVILKFVKDKI